MAEFGATTYVWRADVRRIALRIARRVGCSVNNYVNHGNGMAPQLTSADFWAPAGRGYYISPKAARRVMRQVRRHSRRHPWAYMIYWNTGYLPDGSTFVPFGGDAWNAGHVHVSWR